MLLSGLALLLYNPLVADIHYHAGFRVYKDGQLQDFSGPQYMHLEMCSVDEGEHEDDQLEKAHLHSAVGDVVHVHRDGAVWQDLFTNIGVSIDKDARGYTNGQTIPSILATPIEPGASVIIVAGDESGVDLTNFVSSEYIQRVESLSETCGS